MLGMLLTGLVVAGVLSCGSSSPSPRKCYRCGATVHANTGSAYTYCSHCGHAIRTWKD